ncbi:UNVERIFIED_CONTAM: hypothetical protein RMT77_002917 [Armadillidium vulgare]
MVSNIDEATSILEALEDTIISDLDTSSKSITTEERQELLSKAKADISLTKRARAVIKRKETLLLKAAFEMVREENDSHSLTTLLDEVSLRLEEIRQLDSEIEDSLCKSYIVQYDSTLLDEEIVSASQYNLEIQKVLNHVRPSTPPSPPRSERSAVSQENSVSKAELRTVLSYHPPRELSLPKLKCISFSGGKEDRFLFRSFLLSYNNVYGCRLDISEAAKLQYLKSHLSGYALKDIEHLSNVDENLEVALDILKGQYLDEPYIVDSLMHRIDSAPILSGKNLEDVRAFIAEVRAYLHELKEFGCNFLEENTPGCKFLSHVIVDKLPSIFLRELKLITQEEYPSINIIFKHSNYILKSLEKTREKNSFYGKEKTTKVSSSSPRRKSLHRIIILLRFLVRKSLSLKKNQVLQIKHQH